jgi:multiple sugar transport system ATP-binding protein
MAFSLELAKRERRVVEEHVNRAAAILGLNELAQRYPRQLSGGQRQHPVCRMIPLFSRSIDP